MTAPVRNPDCRADATTGRRGEVSATHELKTWPEHFQAIADGRKTFELRPDDRGFTDGDWLVLREYDPDRDEFTGREVRAWVMHVLRDAPQFGLMPGYAVLSLGPSA